MKKVITVFFLLVVTGTFISVQANKQAKLFSPCTAECDRILKAKINICQRVSPALKSACMVQAFSTYSSCIAACN